MNHPDYNSPAELKAFLEENGMAMQKKFGQNFMLNEQAREKIIDALEVGKDMCVWEIGPGLGCMTDILLQRECNVSVFEIDRGFIKFLHSFFESYENNNTFRIVEGDCLKTWKKHYESCSEKPVRLMGNLPYNIAATFIADTISKGVIPEKCIFTIQKEVADRMTAKPGTENYSAFSVICQYAYNLKNIITLAPGNFWPKPNVSSTAVLLEKKDDILHLDKPEFFFRLIHALFSSRRKTVSNNIKQILPQGIDSAAMFEQAGISPSERAENLSVEQFVKLSQAISSAIINREKETV